MELETELSLETETEMETEMGLELKSGNENKNRVHKWKLETDGPIYDSISECYQCCLCGLSKLVYGDNDFFKVDIDCEGDNNGTFVSSEDFIMVRDETIRDENCNKEFESKSGLEKKKA